MSGTQNITIQRQQHHQRPALSPRSSSSSNHSISPKQGFATILQPPPKQDRERRKAQNRASQRAYRERKEIQLRDLAASLKETEAAMAEAKQENLRLAARLDSMRNDLEGLKKENEALRRMDGRQDAQRQVTEHRGMVMPTPPPMDEGYEGESPLNSASVIGTPTDMELTVDGFDWESLSQGKQTPLADPPLDEAEVFW
jgi:septal ring factor EnvC (AmiA/AmiB activator)